MIEPPSRIPGATATRDRLAEAAFGDAPNTWPLPAATTGRQLWLRAVAAGGQGRFARAQTDLAAVLRAAPSGGLASLACSTRGSFLRQLGWHDMARGWDGRAVLLARSDAEARSDALVGLAADALGVGRFAASAALLHRAEHAPDLPDAVAGRLAVRRGWVSAELAMVTGDGAAAVRHAERAVDLAGAVGSARHRVKSDVVLAGALCCAGHTDRARAIADAALDRADALGLAPLQWALACLLADTGSATRPVTSLVEIRDGCAALVEHRGGRWRHR